jgi:GGDEF domain-containing protein
LRANVRREDLVCRAGPTSFGVILAGVGREEALALRARVGRAVDEACGAMAASEGGRLALKMSIWEVGPD